MDNCVAKADNQQNIAFHKHVFTCNPSVVSNPKKEHITIRYRSAISNPQDIMIASMLFL